MIVQTRYMKGKQVNRATIFDFVQAHKNDGDNIISNDRINASWCIEFLIDYLYQVISIFNTNVSVKTDNNIGLFSFSDYWLFDFVPLEDKHH